MLLEKVIATRKQISVSGVQEKIGVVRRGNQLQLLRPNERSTHLLKPIPRDLLRVGQVPANEHLTMQIARQVYGLDVAANALMFFQTGEPVYVTRRFDIRPDGSKANVVDFAALMGVTTANAGSYYKYEASYETVAQLLQQYSALPELDTERFFQLVIFNFLFGNGDAHLKNFSLLETQSDRYRLSPAYDLLNTSLHVRDTDFALSEGLFANQKTDPNPERPDFITFGTTIDLSLDRATHLLLPFQRRQSEVEALIARSFLDRAAQNAYRLSYRNRRNRLDR